MNIPLQLAITLLIYVLGTTPASAQDSTEPSGQNAQKKKPRNPAMQPVEDVVGLPRVLLVGDSISIGYTVAVREQLKGIANVHRPLTNCGPTTKGVAELEKWLGDKPWDVIHFNFGLHDLKYMGPDGQNLADPADPTSRRQVSPSDYAKNLQKIVQILEGTDAQLIWRNTTPVPPGAKGRVVGDAEAYNAIAEVIMQHAGIAIDDHYAFALANMEDIQQPANVHFTPEGSSKLAQLAVESIRTALEDVRDSK
jgi:hypothetical protein